MAQTTSTRCGAGPNPLDSTGLCLLSLDGGGVRGLSTLYILKMIMDRLNYERKTEKLSPVKPCEVFDLIGGTNTGGLIAIMLGRLEMDVDQCITAYSKLADDVFGEKLRSIPINAKGKIKARFDSTKLETAISKAVEQSGISEADLFNDGTSRGCRTFVCTADRSTKAIVRLRSYSLPYEPNIPATICQAALATSAATTFFDPVSIGNRSFADGGLGANNPVDEVEGEATNIWCSETGDLKPLVKCFISIGTGKPGTEAFEDSMIKFLAQTVVQIATETEITENKFIAKWARHYDEKRYYRFNVEQGLQSIGLDEYKKRGDIEAATEQYLTYLAQKFRVRDCIQNLKLKQRLSQPTATMLNAAIFSSENYYNYGADDLSQHFTGRQVVLTQIAETFFVNSSLQQEPSVVILHGTGGIGKSQTATKFASLYRSRYKIIYKVDCTARTTVEENLDTFAQEILSDPPITLQARLIRLKITLSLSDISWLLIFDGYDQIEGTPEWFRLDQYFPRTCSSSKGNIIITSKYDGITCLGKGIRLSLLDPQEAAKLLLATSGIKESTLELGDINTACEQLDRIPLVVDVAGNYVRNEISRRAGETCVEQKVLRDYLLRHDKKRDEFREHLLHHRSSIPTHQSYGRTIYAAWSISFDVIQAIDEAAAKLLLLLSFLDPVAVSSESAYVRNAFVCRRRWNKEGNLQILNASEMGMPDWLLKVVGKQEVLENGKPDISSTKLEAAISLLISYSLLRKSTNLTNGYDNWGSHSVHRDCARIYCTEKQQSLEFSACALNIFLGNRPDVLIETRLKTPDEWLHASSLLLLELFLTSDAMFRPFENCLGDSYSWDRIIKTFVAAVDIQLVHSLGLNMAESLTALAFIACTMSRTSVGEPISPTVLRESLHEVLSLKAGTFDGTYASVLYYCYKVDYFSSGKGLSTTYLEPSKLIDSKALGQVLKFFETKKSFEKYTLGQLNAVSDILVALSKLFVFNEADDNAALGWNDNSLRQTWPRWLDLRHSGLLQKYVEQCETFISRQNGELLFRTRARLLLEFCRELRGIPRFGYTSPSMESAPSFQERKIVNELLFSLIIAMSDLEELGIDHICATGFALYFIFDFLGCILRIGQFYNKPIFEKGARLLLSRNLLHVSQVMKRPVHSKMLKELFSENLSDASWNRKDKCVFCGDFWDVFMKMNGATINMEDMAEKMVAKFRDGNETLIQKAVTVLENLQNLINRFESADPSDYANRDKIEGQIQKILTVMGSQFSSQNSVFDHDTLVQQWFNMMVPTYSTTNYGKSIEPYLVSKLSNMPRLDNSRLLQLRQECFSKLRPDQQVHLTSQSQHNVKQEIEPHESGSSAISGIYFPQLPSITERYSWSWYNKHNTYRFSELHRIQEKTNLYYTISVERLEQWNKICKEHSDWPLIINSTTIKEKTKQSNASGELQPLYERFQQQIEEHEHRLERMEDLWKFQQKTYLTDFQIQHLNLALYFGF